MPAGIYIRKSKDYGVKLCPICGVAFGKKPKEKPYKFRQRKCCSRRCNAKLSASYCVGKKAHNNRRVKRVCSICGKEEMVSPCFANRPYCSRDCMAKGYKARVKERSSHWQGGKWKRYCLVCGKEFEFDKGDLKRCPNSRLFCSQSCKAQYQHIGEGNPNWKGGIQPEHLKIRNSKGVREWKLECLERDNHTCQKCGAIEGLHVHHIKSFDEFPELRAKLENGITLCGDCHYEIHYKLSG